MNAPTTTTYQFFTFAQLAQSANREARAQFGLGTPKEVMCREADMLYSDPDFLRMPEGGSATAFMEVGGIIVSKYPLSEAQRAAILGFFNGQAVSDNEFTNWLDCFGGDAHDEDADPFPFPRIAYRGGEGYCYSFSEVHP